MKRMIETIQKFLNREISTSEVKEIVKLYNNMNNVLPRTFAKWYVDYVVVNARSKTSEWHMSSMIRSLNEESCKKTAEINRMSAEIKDLQSKIQIYENAIKSLQDNLGPINNQMSHGK